jgi:pteridine reductase
VKEIESTPLTETSEQRGVPKRGMSRRPLHALITGAGARIGRAVALELARSGFEVGLHYCANHIGATETLERLQAEGGTGWLARADLSTEAGCDQLCQEVNVHWEHLDLLVNNASIFEPTPFEEITRVEWSQMLQVNLTAPFLLSQALLPLLKRTTQTSGLVVHLCDIGADRPLSGYAHYAVSKAGLVMLVKAMAVELAPAVRCVGVSPGQVAWPPDFSQETREALEKRIPMKRSGAPEDIAQLVRFLALEGGYINGEVIAVDGGLSCRY